MTVAVERIGQEAQPLCVLDDFAPDPDALRAFAAAAEFGPGLHYYPGVRAALPERYLAEQLPVIAAAGAALGRRGAIEVIDASFSIVSTPAEALQVAQRLPHVDAFTPDRIALVHYLSPEGGDGTAFFRHRATGFETVGEDRRALYFGQLDRELRYGGPLRRRAMSRAIRRCSPAPILPKRATTARFFIRVRCCTAGRSAPMRRCRPTRASGG